MFQGRASGEIPRWHVQIIYSHYRGVYVWNKRSYDEILGKMWFEISLLHRTPRSVDFWMTSSRESNGNHQQMQCECMPLIGCLLPWTNTLPLWYILYVYPPRCRVKGNFFPKPAWVQEIERKYNKADKSNLDISSISPSSQISDLTRWWKIITLSTWKRWGSGHSKLNGRIIYVKCDSTFLYHLKNHIPDPKISDPHVSWMFLGPVGIQPIRIDRKWKPWPFSISNDFDFRPFFCGAFFCTVSWGRMTRNGNLLGWGKNPVSDSISTL